MTMTYNWFEEIPVSPDDKKRGVAICFSHQQVAISNEDYLKNMRRINNFKASRNSSSAKDRNKLLAFLQTLPSFDKRNLGMKSLRR